MSRPMVITISAMAAVTVGYAVLAYSRRWISDDGLIVVRTVRELLAGNGPTFNAFERAEANTSTLWTYVLALVAAITPGDVAFTAVVTGGVLAVGSVVLAMDATRRWHLARGTTAPLVPFGILVVIGASPFWDYATSGLESGLSLFWIACCWWLLVRLRGTATWRRQLATSVVFGLGPLVRPDFAMASIVWFGAQIWLARPISRWRIVALGAVGVALPVAYEIFRAGYYGALVPLPALAKGASASEWARGIEYLRDFIHPYWIGVPLVLIILLFAMVNRRLRLAHRDGVLLAAPVVAAVLMTGFVVRVGGDFMHGRMCLPPLFAFVAPAALVPLHRWTQWFVAAIAVWAVAIAIVRADGRSHATALTVEDERYGYARWTHELHPDTTEIYRLAEGLAAIGVDQAAKRNDRRLLSEGGVNVPMNPERPGPLVFAVGRLGTGGAVTPVDGIVADTLGLANPLGARITATQPGRTGHEKSLPWPWLLADFADPLVNLDGVANTKKDVTRAARHAMTCGDLHEMLEAARAPMTPSRFWANLTGAFHRTRFEIPSDPFEAEDLFCGVEHSEPHVVVSSSYEADNWSADHVVDGVLESIPRSLGYSSAPGVPQWIELDFRAARSVSQVTLYPRTDAPAVGGGFPIDFVIQTWNGTAWVDRVSRTDYPSPGAKPQVIALPTPQRTDKIRLFATRLPKADFAGVRLQLAEITVP